MAQIAGEERGGLEEQERTMPPTCLMCGLSFNTKGELDDHNRMVHGKSVE